MKLKDIRAGMTCTVGWFSPGGKTSVRRDYLASGSVVFRKAGRIKFRWESGDSMDSDFIATPNYSREYFWVNVFDIKGIDGISIEEWQKLEKPAAIAKAEGRTA